MTTKRTIHIPRCLLLGSPLLEPREKRGTPSFYTANLRTIRGSVQHPDLGHPSNPPFAQMWPTRRPRSLAIPLAD